MCEKRLFSGERSLYSFRAAAKSAAGIGVLSNSMATRDAPCVFFCVYASVPPFFGQRFIFRCAVCVMVARAGASHEAPVSIEAGYANPVRATTSEIGVSGGGVNRYSMEIVIMTTAPAAAHPEFTFIFAAVRRTDTFARPCMLRTVAGDERTARLRLVREYVLSSAGRLPVKAVAA